MSTVKEELTRLIQGQPDDSSREDTNVRRFPSMIRA